MMLAAILLPVALMAVIGLSMLLKAEQASRIRSIHEIARSTSQLIDMEIAAAQAALTVAAHSEELGKERFEDLYHLFKSTEPSPMTWTLVADRQGTGVMNTLVPFGTPLSSNTGHWAAEIIERQQPRVSDYFLGSTSKKGVVSVSVPVVTKTGTQYVFSRIFDPKLFEKIFASSSIQPSWVIGVFDANGTSIVRNKNPARLVGKPVVRELYFASRAQGSGMVRHRTRDNVEVYDTFVRSGLTNWTVAIGVPVDEFEAASAAAVRYAAVALILVMTGAAAIAVFFGRRIDQSLRAATSAAHGLASGGVVGPGSSHLEEANVLLSALHTASDALSRERKARAALEVELEKLVDKERAARRQADNENAAKDNFLAMLSHELRNPLSAIGGAIGVIQLPGMPSEKLSRAWSIVNRQLRHLTSMLDDLLEVRRVLSGKIVLDRRRLDIGDVLRFCCDSRMVATDKKLTWDIKVREAWVLGDRKRLEQVFDNLLVNAVKFTGDGGRISVQNVIMNQMVVIEVADSGAGIAADVLPTIFDALVQGPTTIDRSQGGLGLGLSIVKGLVLLHNGTIEAASEGAGQGTTLTLRLPLCDDSL